MNLVDGVYKIAEQFMEDPEWVKINYTKIGELARTIIYEPQPIFPLPDITNSLKSIVIELVSASINYCYWYGKSTVRPNEASSTTMYNILQNCFYDFKETENQFSICIERLIKHLAMERFPLLEERAKHLRELKDGALQYCNDIDTYCRMGFGTNDWKDFFLTLITKFPGFGSDIFLKRASLFFIQLNRRFDYFSEEVKTLHVPADYQIPKMLEYYECITYHPYLSIAITDDQLIPKNSKMECELRSATILAIRELCKLTGWSVTDVDTYFFTKRHEPQQKFHLTITTDY